MVRSILLVALLPVLAVSGCGSSGGGSAAESAIRGQVSKAMTCVQNVDVTGFMACVAPDFKEDGTTRDDVEGVLLLFAPEIASVKASYTVDVSHISGDTASVTIRGHLVITGVDPANSGRIPETGEMSLPIICKSEGGQWLAYGNQRDAPPGVKPFLSVLQEKMKGLHQ